MLKGHKHINLLEIIFDGLELDSLTGNGAASRERPSAAAGNFLIIIYTVYEPRQTT